MIRVFFAAWFILALFSACSSTPILEEQPSSQYPDLHRVSGSGFNDAWVRPGAALSSYDSIQITPIISANADIKQPSTTPRIRQDWELTPERQQTLIKGWHEAMVAAADKHGVDSSKAGHKTLRVSAAITRIAPTADFQQEQQAPGRSTVYTEDSGELSIRINLYDDKDGELLAVIEDRRRVGSRIWGPSSTVTASADVRNLLNRWANQLLSRITTNREPAQ